ncbi:hypothetical protein [Bilifractor porci]|uniref:Alternate signal-mediated exported protein n=1 Tax=Bilifractor porci TaxID=2606636 RepID=A0A7X2P8V5_9FIRM|nr:hypothetical protein [Bilifractor porci]MST82367.1 hypothetical protein [Bilifractor porci]
MKGKAKLRIFILGCLALLITGSSLAFWSGKIDHTNRLKADQMSAKIEEVFDPDSEARGTVPKSVSFQNDSSCAAFLRVAYAETWDSNGLLLNNQIDGKDVAVKHWLSGFGQDSDLWKDGGDGWFYYKKILQPGEKTDPVLESVTFPFPQTDASVAFPDINTSDNYAAASYQLYFRMELLQVSDSHATLNSEEVNEKASSTIFGKTATVSGDSVEWK